MPDSEQSHDSDYNEESEWDTASSMNSPSESMDSTSPDPDPTLDSSSPYCQSGYFIQLAPPHLHGYHLIPRYIAQQQVYPRYSTRYALQSSLIPTCFHAIPARYEDRAYSGQFSADGALFYSTTQDFKVHVYKVASDWSLNPWQECVMRMGGWTITDCHLSTDNQFIVSSSITPFVYLSRVKQDEQESTQSPTQLTLSQFNLGIWSVRFSGDGRQLIAGTSHASILVYDIETKTLLYDIQGHQDDVNSVCFAHPLESHVVFTASDDATIKVWQVFIVYLDRRDQRSLGQQDKPSGVLQGHTQGITYITSKGDGRYCLSNGKDQTMKLWDIRKMTSADVTDQKDIRLDFDYRMEPYPYKRPRRHSQDSSVLSMTGHSVLKTLIRCHFSPQGQRFAYTGSADGHVYLYDLHQQGKQKMKISIKKALQHVDPHHPIRPRRPLSFFHHGTVTRDVAWHPSFPMMISSTWGTDMGEEGCLVQHCFRI